MDRAEALEVAHLVMQYQMQSGDRFLPDTIEEVVSEAVKATSHDAACDAMESVFRRKLVIQAWGDPIV